MHDLVSVCCLEAVAGEITAASFVIKQRIEPPSCGARRGRPPAQVQENNIHVPIHDENCSVHVWRTSSTSYLEGTIFARDAIPMLDEISKIAYSNDQQVETTFRTVASRCRVQRSRMMDGNRERALPVLTSTKQDRHPRKQNVGVIAQDCYRHQLTKLFPIPAACTWDTNGKGRICQPINSIDCRIARYVVIRHLPNSSSLRMGYAKTGIFT